MVVIMVGQRDKYTAMLTTCGESTGADPGKAVFRKGSVPAVEGEYSESLSRNF